MKIIAAVTHEAGAKFAIENVELQEPKTGEILVKVLASGICHTDVEGDAGHLPTASPAVPKVFIPQMIEYYRQGRFPVDRIMQFYDFEDINRAYEDSLSGKCIKAVVRMKK